MDYGYSWADNDGAGYSMAKAHGLKSPQPIMWSTPKSGNCMCMFQSGSEYYIWNPIDDEIWEIVTSMNHYNGDGQVGIRIAEAYGGTSDIDLPLILGWKMIGLR